MVSGGEENPWNMTPPTPHVLVQIKKGARNSVVTAVVALVLSVAFAIWGFRPFVRFMDDGRADLIALLVALLIPLWAVWTLFRSGRLLASPWTHPTLAWPSMGNPQQVARHIDWEMAETSKHTHIGAALFTPSWLLRHDNWNFQATPLSVIAWAYPHVTVQKQYFITIGKDYSVQVWLENGKDAGIPAASEAQAQEILQQIALSAPWAITGFSERLAATWEKARPTFLQAVAERKQKITAGLPNAEV